MKLFLWSDPYAVSYGSSMLIAVAKSESEARKEAEKGLAYSFGKYKNESILGGLAKTLGKPDRVLDLPCAEWHEWFE